MNNRMITVCVDVETAEAYESLSDVGRRKFDLLINQTLKEIARGSRSLENVMTEVSEKAQSRGLTPEILDSILAEA